MASSSLPPSDQKPCPKCKLNTCSVKARGESMCTDCFIRYVGSKVSKRLDSYKVRTNVPPRKVLLALSLGVSSLTLLHIISKQMRTSFEKIGRCGYDLHICIMDDMSVFGKDAKNDQEDKERIKQISELYYDDREKWPMIKDVVHKSTEECFGSMASDDYDADLRDLVASSQADQTTQLGSPETYSSYARFIASLPSPSARSDLNTVLTHRFIIRHAQQLGCDTIFWGDSTTRLAERTLAETAKGRGFSMPWQTSDGPTPFDLDFTFPMRDLLRKEVIAYAELADPPLTTLAKPQVGFGVPQASSKEATIDALMAQYFESVEENFPSIVTNVVRTANRLEPDAKGNSGNKCCHICALPVSVGTDGLHGWAGSQQDDISDIQTGFYCYGCARSTKGRKL